MDGCKDFTFSISGICIGEKSLFDKNGKIDKFFLPDFPEKVVEVPVERIIPVEKIVEKLVFVEKNENY
tara:strand:+ start:1277 stop:1480 length:204 start_codon:yes stop_codon:yes gene_type:complete